MPEPFRVGKQTTHFEEPDIIFMKMIGEVTAEEGLAINEKHTEYVRGRDRIFYLIDFSELESVPAPVRKAASETIKEFPLEGLALFNAPLKARVLVKLILTAMKLFRGGGPNVPLLFFDTEEEARTWITNRRTEIAQQN